MAIKMVFHPSEENFYSEELISFTYVQGLAFSQKQKCADSLHHSILQLHPGSHILEVSTKSREKIGVAASAFNLRDWQQPPRKRLPIGQSLRRSRCL
jgi:hypothetical protein